MAAAHVPASGALHLVQRCRKGYAKAQDAVIISFGRQAVISFWQQAAISFWQQAAMDGTMRYVPDIAVFLGERVGNSAKGSSHWLPQLCRGCMGGCGGCLAYCRLLPYS